MRKEINEKDPKVVAQKVVDALKKAFLTAKKENKGNPSYNIETWSRKVGGETSYYLLIGCANEEFGHMQEHNVSRCHAELILQLKALQKTRGFKNLVVDKSERGNYPWYYDAVEKVSLLAEPCKEYTKLQKYIAKHANCAIADFDLYSVGMGGKRGYLYGESGNRNYLAHNPKKCEMYLKQMQDAKGAKDIMTCNVTEGQYIDEEERRCSSYYETECSGEKLRYADITIKTPKGKNKLCLRVY